MILLPHSVLQMEVKFYHPKIIKHEPILCLAMLSILIVMMFCGGMTCIIIWIMNGRFCFIFIK